MIHVGTNDVFKSSEVEIIEGIKDLINISKDKWSNAQHIFFLNNLAQDQLKKESDN